MKKRAEERGEPQRELRPTGFTRRRPLSRLILTGFMGAGKSTVGAILAQTLVWQFIDLDGYIEASEGKTVAEIFSQQGEAYFRRQERRAVQEVSREQKLVLALGGGAVEDDFIRSFLLNLSESCLVFLDAPLPELLARCAAAGRTRPLLTASEPLELRHARRLPHYRAAQITVPTLDLAPQEVARQVLAQILKKYQIETSGDL